MKNWEQLIYAKDLQGRTVKYAFTHMYIGVIISFTDNTYAVISYDEAEGIAVIDDSSLSVSEFNKDFAIVEALFDKTVADDLRARIKKLEEENKSYAKRKRYNQYLALKKEFESNETTVPENS